jgi:hypothetical protein
MRQLYIIHIRTLTMLKSSSCLTPFFLRYYASLKSHLKFICERFAEKSSQSSRLSDISVDNFLSK